MTTENEAVGILHGIGESKISLRHPYKLVKMKQNYNFSMLMRGTHQHHLSLLIAFPSEID